MCVCSSNVTRIGTLQASCVASVAFCGKAALVVTWCLSYPGFGKGTVLLVFFWCCELNCISLDIAHLFPPTPVSATVVYQMLYGYRLICSQTDDSAVHTCWSSIEQVFFCGWLLTAEESLFFPASSVSLTKYTVSPCKWCFLRLIRVWQCFLKQALRWENGRVWRKDPGLPRAPGICTGEKSLVVMSFKNISIKKQSETGIENLEEEGKSCN